MLLASFKALIPVNLRRLGHGAVACGVTGALMMRHHERWVVELPL
jgi:hypothetical protein